jgi:2-methylfumaryl-CoA hydratase
MVLDYVRWVMVRKRDPASSAPEAVIPSLLDHLPAEQLVLPPDADFRKYDTALAGSPFYWEDYQKDERLDHVDGMTIEEAEHMMATRLYQNSAKVHFNQHSEAQGRFGRRLIYGGHIISLTRALSFNGLGNAVKLAAINGGRHVGPSFAGDTIYGWSRIKDRWEIAGRRDVGALRIESFAAKNHPCADFPGDQPEAPHPDLVLAFDYTVLLPRRD